MSPRPSKPLTEEAVLDVKVPEPKGINKPSIAALTKKIKAQRDFLDKETKRNGQAYIFEMTNGNSQTYMLKGESIINIPDDWEKTPHADYIREAFQGREVLTGEQVIRYVRGESTIFRDLQSDAAEKKGSEYIVFNSGVRNEPCRYITNNKRDPNLFNFLMVHNRNASNPFSNGAQTYKLISKAKEAKKRLVDETVKMSAINWAMTRTEDEVMAVASVLGIQEYDYGVMRNAVLDVAYKNPSLFMGVVNDDLLPVKSTYILAKQVGILSQDGNIIKWRATDGVLQIIPRGKEKEELQIMSEWLSSDAGMPTYDAIIGLMNK